MTITALAFSCSPAPDDRRIGVQLALAGPRLRIGRARPCELRLPDGRVSPHHASLVHRGDGYVLIDEGSAAGTWLGDRRLRPGEPYPVGDFGLARFGPFWVELRAGLGRPVDTPFGRAQFTRRLLALSLWQRGWRAEACFVVREGRARGGLLYGPRLVGAQSEADGVRSGHRPRPPRGPGLVWLRDLPSGPLRIGREPRADLRLEDMDVSRFHALLTRRDGAFWVRDLGSTNGTLLDGERVPRDAELPWGRDAALRVGSNVLLYEDPLADALAELDAERPEAAGPASLAPFEPPPAGRPAPPARPEAAPGADPWGSPPMAPWRDETSDPAAASPSSHEAAETSPPPSP